MSIKYYAECPRNKPTDATTCPECGSPVGEVSGPDDAPCVVSVVDGDDLAAMLQEGLEAMEEARQAGPVDNVPTRNHKFWMEEGQIKSRPATFEEIEEMREDSTNGEWMALGRSCWECNGAHGHLVDMPNMNCFACGRYYHRGVDITQYAEEDEAQEVCG